MKGRWFLNRTLVTTLFLVIASIAGLAEAGELVRHADRIPGEYIVVFEDSASDFRLDARIDALAARFDARVLYRFRDAFRGFSARMTPEAALAISRSPAVRFVEENARIQLPRREKPVRSIEPNVIISQPAPVPWHLDRIDQRQLPLSGTYTYSDQSDGNGVHIYIVDSGIHYTHVDFAAPGGGTRVDTNTLPGTRGSINLVPGEPASQIDDCFYHGTLVASVAAGNTYGVAKRSTLHAVRIANCAGSSSTTQIATGINWIIQNRKTPAVVNISYNYPDPSPTLDNAISNLLLPSVNISVVVSSGNTTNLPSIDVTQNTPGRMGAGVLVVGASDQSDVRRSSSCYGATLDLYAPGTGITGAAHNSNTLTLTTSGTSFAAPQVTGWAAAILQTSPWLTPYQVENVVLWWATANQVTENPGAPKAKLLYRVP